MSPTASRRRRLGLVGEQLAADHLARLGYRLLARNFRTRHGELDVIALDGPTLVFCEVKTVRSGAGVGPWDQIGARKRCQLERMARAYLHAAPSRPRAPTIRFDAVGIVLDADERLVALDHLQGAW